MAQRGRLIVVEGIDGAGKETLVASLADRLAAAGQPAERLTRYLMPELVALWKRLVAASAVDQRQAAALAAADLAVGAAHRIRPALEAGRWVVMDGYLYAHRVHFQLRGVPHEELDALFSQLPEPDAILYLRVPLQLALQRVLPRHQGTLVWSTGQDTRADIGRAWSTREQSKPADIEAAFLSWQARAQALYPAVLPADRTTPLRGDLSPEALLQAAWDALPPR